ncbi:MAG: hypothetical protein ABL985_00165 [Casimicrobium sp.]
MEQSYRRRINCYDFPHLIPEPDPAHLHAAQIESPAVKIGRIAVFRCRCRRHCRDANRKEITVGGITMFLCNTDDDEYSTD